MKSETEVNLDHPTKKWSTASPNTVKKWKAVSLDNINPEVLKVDTEITVEMLYPVLEITKKEETIPEE